MDFRFILNYDPYISILSTYYLGSEVKSKRPMMPINRFSI